MAQTLTFRAGRPEDSSDLAILFDAAARRVTSWFWGTMASPGQSWLEVGRSRIRDMPDNISFHANWRIAELEGRTVGGLFGFSVPETEDRNDMATVEEVLRPMYELEIVAHGCWLLQSITMFPENRGQSFGPVLLEEACRLARAAGHSRIVLQVESPNIGAIGLYRKFGFTEWQRRVFVPFPGSDDTGDWILMVRDI